MNIGTVIFAYNRPRHLKKVLDGLKKNKIVGNIYIFQDGLKKEEHRIAWEETQKVIGAIDWIMPRYELAEQNLGLANSIIRGINKVLEENDAVIVLEDDCVPQSGFTLFMKQCFEKYACNESVYCISGYSWPITLENNFQSDIYFNGRISSYGWGTWKNKWKEYSRDFGILERLKISKEGSENLALWGNDLEKMLIDRLIGQNDSWAVFWALHVIEKGGICINPYLSLISNIGNDGSGVHQSTETKYNSDQNLEQQQKEQYLLPEKVEIEDRVKIAFAKLHGSYTAANYELDHKERALVYGIGNWFFAHEEEVNEKYEIIAFIDNYKKGFYAGKRIIQQRDIVNYTFDKVFIAIQNMYDNLIVFRTLVKEFEIAADKIIIGVIDCKGERKDVFK